MSRWFVVSTRRNQEGRAADNLRRQSFNVWFPRLRRTRRHARRFDTVLAPLFPGYLFVEFDPKKTAWRPINGTLGVQRIVCDDHGPLPLPESFMSSLQRRSNGSGIFSENSDTLVPGSEVKVISGPLTDCIGILLQANGPERVRLLLRLLGGNVNVVLAPSAVVPLG